VKKLEHHCKKALDHQDNPTWIICLKMYASLDACDKAEKIYREHIVVPYLEELNSREVFRMSSGPLQHDILQNFYEAMITFIEKQQSIYLLNTYQHWEMQGCNILTRSLWPEIVQILLKKMNSMFMPVVSDVFFKVSQVYRGSVLGTNAMPKEF
jgi:hypothetical protein